MRFVSVVFFVSTLASTWAVPLVPVPVIDGDWWQVAGDPDLGSYTRANQQPVDFAVWQAADGTWQLWSCIRGTGIGGNSRLFYGWEGAQLTDADWAPMGIKMTARTDLGETAGGLQAPHVVRWKGMYHMLYGDWVNICRAVSVDGKNFERVILPNGKTGMFTEGPSGYNTRDPMALWTAGLWYVYYTAIPNNQGMDYVRSSTDLAHWSESRVASAFGESGTGGGSAECPFVIEYASGMYYLFRTQQYGASNISRVYFSTDPTYFGINQDERYLVGSLPVAAPEFILAGTQWYVAALLPSLKGIRMARLRWEPPVRRGAGLFDFDDAAVRAGWTRVSGNLATTFTNSTRSNFSPPYQWFIGTAEIDGTNFDDNLTGIIESPTFTLQHDRYVMLVSGGSGLSDRYVALESATGEEIARLSGSNNNAFSDRTVDVSSHVGRTVKIRVVDQATGSWGHVNFGGMFQLEPLPIEIPTPTPTPSPARRADINEDGFVDREDLLLLHSEWGR